MLSGKQLVVLLILLLLPLWFAAPSLSITDQEQEIRRNIEIFKNPNSSTLEKEATQGRLVTIGPPAVPALIQTLVDKNYAVRFAAADALGEMGPAAIEAIPALIRLLGDEYSFRDAAAYALEKMGPAPKEAIAALIKLLGDEDYKVRSVAASVLGKMGQTAVPALSKALGDGKPEVRSAAAEALGDMGQPAQAAIPDLIQALGDGNPKVRSAAAQALGKMGAAKEAISALMGDEKPEVRRAAAWALGRMGQSAVPALSNALKDNDASVRCVAAKALGDMGQPAQAAIPDLIQALEDENSSVRSDATDALGRMGPVAVPALIKLLGDEKPGVGTAATNALGRMGPVAVPALRQALGDGNPEVRGNAMSALGIIGPAAQAAIPDLMLALKDNHVRVRPSAAFALGQMGPAAQKAVPDIVQNLGDWIGGPSYEADALEQIGPAANEAIPALSKALQNKSRPVRYGAAFALGQLGPAAQVAIPDFVAAFGEADQSDREMAAKALLKIVQPEKTEKNLDRAALQGKILQLENLQKTIFKDFNEPPYKLKHLADQLENIIERLRLESKPPFLIVWIEKNLYEKWWARAIAGYVALLLIVLPIWLLLLWVRPIWLYWLNEKVSWVSLKLPYIEGPVGLRQLSLLSPFHYCNRVLDAWVQTHLSQARTSFGALDTVRDRAVHVAIPVILNGHTVAQPSPEDFQEVFRKTPFCLLIWGEGGSGKTSLACQLAGWALTGEPVPMLAKHRLLPVLIEHDLKIEAAPGQNPLLEAIRKQVVERLTAGQEIAPELLRQLLGQQRLLVIVDHYSELSSDTRERIHPGYDPQLPLHAVIVTSRQEEKFQGSVTDTLKPLRIRGNRLSSFMEAYLTQRGKRELYDDTEFFAACDRLTEMVGDRNITVLLARMFADQMIATKEDPDFQDLPHNIPDLMLSYLNWINRSGKEENPTVQRITKAISWASLESTFRPTDGSLAAIHQALAGEPEIDQKLQYLCRDLGIIRWVGPAEDKVRVTLDPLAEYLAGLRMLELYGDKDKSWKAFLEEADKKEGAPHSIEGFLLAVRDCCLAKGKEYGVPMFVEQQLAQKTGINLESKPG